MRRVPLVNTPIFTCYWNTKPVLHRFVWQIPFVGVIGFLLHHIQNSPTSIGTVIWIAIDGNGLLQGPHIILPMHIHSAKEATVSASSYISGRECACTDTLWTKWKSQDFSEIISLQYWQVGPLKTHFMITVQQQYFILNTRPKWNVQWVSKSIT